MSLTEGKETLAQCRLCTSKIGEHQNVEIFGPDGLAKDVAKKIEDCLPICVSRGDSFPQTVCLTCLEKLDRSYNFLKQCLNAELSFEQNWSKTHPAKSNEFSLEPECCLREVDPEGTQSNNRPIELFKAETLPQPKKRARGLEDFIILPIAPPPPPLQLTSTPLTKSTSSAPRLGAPDPDDYILVKEEMLDISHANANNLIEFYASKMNQGAAKDTDIIGELRRRDEILPPMFDVYERRAMAPVVRRRYIVNKEAFPCTLCNNCFAVDRGFPRASGILRSTLSSHENDINFLNGAAAALDRNHNHGNHGNHGSHGNHGNHGNHVSMGKRVKTEQSPVVSAAKRKAKAAKRLEMPNLLPIQQSQMQQTLVVSPVKPAQGSKPRVSQMIISTKHQFVGQMFKREPSAGADELGSSVNSEDSESFNDLVIKNFYCELCNKYFPRRSSLKRHQRTHASERVFSCPRCAKSFSRKEHLARHEVLHTEENSPLSEAGAACKSSPEADSLLEGSEALGPTLARPYVCTACCHGFARKEHLQRHKRRMHAVPSLGRGCGSPSAPAGSKPYSCPVCQKTFTRKEHLVRHNKIHIRESLMGSDDSNTIVLSDATLFQDHGDLQGGFGSETKRLGSESKGFAAKREEFEPAAPPFEPLPDLTTLPVVKMSAETVQTIKSLPERLPGLDVSLRVVEPRNVPSILQLVPPPPPNKLDISISLVSESAAAPAPQTPAPTPTAPEMQPPETASPDQPGKLNASEENLMSFLKPFLCEFCVNKRFTRKSHLVRHFKRIHPEKDVTAIAGPSDVKPERLEFNAETFVSNDAEHRCKICDKRFSRRYHLNRHLKLHIAMKSGKIKTYVAENARPFKCSSCEGRFTEYDGFQSHRCTGTEVGSMVLVGNAAPVGDIGDVVKPKVKVRKRKASDLLGGPSKMRRKREALKPGKRVRRKRSRVGYECEVCGVFVGTHKLLVKHMKTHKSLEDDEGVDVERELQQVQV